MTSHLANFSNYSGPTLVLLMTLIWNSNIYSPLPGSHVSKILALINQAAFTAIRSIPLSCDGILCLFLKKIDIYFSKAIPIVNHWFTLQRWHLLNDHCVHFTTRHKKFAKSCRSHHETHFTTIMTYDHDYHYGCKSGLPIKDVGFKWLT